MLIETIKHLKTLKLAGIAKSLEDKISYAQSKQLSHLEFIKLLAEDEFLSRKNNSLKKRTSKSQLDLSKTIESFDFEFQSTINKSQVLDIASCSFIQKKQNIVFMGNPGTGKTHLASAIGMRALLQGYRVLFLSSHDLIKELNQSKADGTYYLKLESYVKVDLLIIDEIGFKKFTQSGADDFFELVNQRYESKSIIITSNKTFEDWASILFNPVLASATIDRLVHHCQIISIKGESYRAKQYQQKNKEKETN